VKPPAVFQSLTFEEATAQARAAGRWLIVAATSSSSELAQMMDKTTWRSAQVVDWFDKHAIGLQVDVDAQPELAAALKITGAPTVLVFKDGEEKDRMDGYLDPARLQIWLAGIERGKATPYDTMMRRGGSDLERNMHARLSFAKSLLNDQSFVKATAHYVWLWRNIERVDPDMRGVRGSFMAREIKELIGVFRPARASFTEIREETGAAADADPAARKLRVDWVTLNYMLGEDDRTLAWFDGVKTSLDAETIAKCTGPHLAELLKARGRWADLGRLCTNPLKQLAFHHQVHAHTDLRLMASMLPKEALGQIEEISRNQFRKSAAELYASLRAAGRTADAKAVQEEALRLDPSEEMNQAIADSPVRYD